MGEKNKKKDICAKKEIVPFFLGVVAFLCAGFFFPPNSISVFLPYWMMASDSSRGGTLRRAGVSADLLEQAYGSTSLEEDEEIRLFGKRREFLGNPGSKAREPGNVYHSFGDAPRGIGNRTSEEHAAFAQKIWEDMPKEIQAMIPKTCIGKFTDGKRDYIPCTDNPSHELYNTYEVRCPLKMTRSYDDTLDSDWFPQSGEILVLEGRGVKRICKVRGDVYNRKKCTAFVEMDVLQETRIGK